MILYIAYPTSLTLRSANALQTYNTARALMRIVHVRLLVPKVPGRISRFAELGAVHLPRLPLNVLSNVVRWPLWPFLERAAFAHFVRMYLKRGMKSELRRVEAVYVRDVVVAGMMAPWARELGLPLIYEVHHLEADNPSAGKGRPGYSLALACESTAMSQAAGVVVLTSHAAEDVAKAWPRLKGRCKVLPDAYDDDIFKPVPRDEARRELGIANRPFLAVYAGLTFAHRDVDLLVRATALLSEDDDAAAALVGGRPKERAELNLLANVLGVADRVFIVGQVDPPRTALWMAAADALVLTGLVSPRASSPLKLFEYMAMGRPMVSVDAPAVREVLGSEDALFFPSGDAEALARCLRTLKGSAQVRDRMGQATLRKASSFTYRARAEALYSFIKEIAG